MQVVKAFNNGGTPIGYLQVIKANWSFRRVQIQLLFSQETLFGTYIFAKFAPKINPEP